MIKLRLIRLGVVLILLGLATGLAAGMFANPRMGLSSHIEGVMNGILLIALGAVWENVRLGPKAERAAFWSLAYGTSVNWLTTLLAAIWGAGSMMPIAAAGRSAAPWQEAIVTAGLLSLTAGMFLGLGLVAYGVLRGRG